MSTESIKGKLSMAIMRYYMHDHKTAGYILSDILRQNPAHCKACELLGQIYQHQGKLLEAESYYAKALEIEPMRSSSNYKLGLMQQELCKFIDAERSLLKAIFNDPHSMDKQLALGKNFMYMRDYNSALHIADKILRNNNEDTNALYFKSYINYLNEGKIEHRILMEQKTMSFAVTGMHYSQESLLANQLLDNYYAMEIFKEHLGAGSNCLDIGAKNGYYSVLMSNWIGVDSVYPIEHRQEGINAIQFCNEKNKNNSFKLNFLGHAIGDGKASISNDPVADFGFVCNRTYGSGLKTITLDSLNLENIDFIKYDSPGFELGFIDGASETLQKSKPKCLIRIRQGSLSKATERMRSYGFIINRGNHNHNSSAIDCLFIPC